MPIDVRRRKARPARPEAPRRRARPLYERSLGPMVYLPIAVPETGDIWDRLAQSRFRVELTILMYRQRITRLDDLIAKRRREAPPAGEPAKGRPGRGLARVAARPGP